MLLFSARNARYTGPTIQSNIISDCNSIILTKLVKQIIQAACFTILADETSYFQEWNSCPFVLDMLSISTNSTISTNILNEIFLRIEPLTEVTGIGIATRILEALQNRPLTVVHPVHLYIGQRIFSTRLCPLLWVHFMERTTTMLRLV